MKFMILAVLAFLLVTTNGCALLHCLGDCSERDAWHDTFHKQAPTLPDDSKEPK